MKLPVRYGALLSVPALALALGGCSIYEQTQGWYPRYDGVTAEAGDIGLRNVLIVASEDGQATMLSSFANRGDADELVSVRIGSADGTLAGGSLEIPALGHAALGPDADQIDFTGVEASPGQITEVEFQFANAPRVTLDAMVKGVEGRYTDVTFTDPTEPVGSETSVEEEPDDPPEDDVPASEPTEEPGDEPTEEPAGDEPVSDATDEPASDPTDEPTGEADAEDDAEPES